MLWILKPRVDAGQLAAVLVMDGLDLRAANSSIQEFVQSLDIPFSTLEREFRLLKLYIIQTAIHTVGRKVRAAEVLSDRFEFWIRNAPPEIEGVQEVIHHWNQRRDQYDDAWANPRGRGTAASIGEAFSSACGDENGMLVSFAGDMLSYLIVQYTNRLRALRITAK